VTSTALARTSPPDLLTDADKETIGATWRLVEPIGETAADLFYRRLFELKPGYRALFKSELGAQKRKLMAMLAFIVKSLNWVDAAWREDIDPESDLFLVVLALGRRHRELYQIPDEAYDTVREALLWTLDYGLGEAFTPEAQTAWQRVYDLVAMTMKLGKGATELGKKIEPGEWGKP
jgi:hemoglobin-like flavoprotein